jgi:predicted amidohydrolase YtcJ
VTRSVAIRDAEVDGRVVDVFWRDGVVQSVHARGEREVEPDAHIVDAGGAALIPGLHDHHIHLLALAASRASVTVGPPTVDDVDGLRRALSMACAASVTGWVRAVGYHESVAGELDADRLAELIPAARDVAIRIQHRSGQLWVLNHRAIRLVRLEAVHHPGVERDSAGRPTGRVFGLDDELRGRIPSTDLDLHRVAAELASYGVTGVTDLTPTESKSEVELLASACHDAAFPLAVSITGGVRLRADVASELPRGPVKILPSDHDLLVPEDLAEQIAGVHALRRPVAIHCVTRVGLVVALAAWRLAGAFDGDRIEHGAVIPDDVMDDIRDLRLIVVTQPNFIAERGDSYLRDVATEDLPHLWRCGSLIDHHIGVAAGTDAPFGHPNPWRAVEAACTRRAGSGAILGAGEELAPSDALELFLGGPQTPTQPRRITPLARTDLALLDRPLADALTDPTTTTARATVGRAGVRTSSMSGATSPHGSS